MTRLDGVLGERCRAARLGAALGPALALLAAVTLLVGCGRTSGAGGLGGNAPGATPTATSGSTTGGTGKDGPISLHVEHQHGTQALSITLNVTNDTDQEMAWDGGCVQPYVVSLTGASGEVMNRWPPVPIGPRCNAITRITLDPGKTATLTVVQTADLKSASGAAIPAGRYSVRAQFQARQYQGHAATFSPSVNLDW